MDRLREYQLRLLSMLKQFDSFAKKNEIPYFLLGGNAEDRDDSFFCIPAARCGGGDGR